MAKEISYGTDLGSILLQQILNGSGDSQTTTTGGGISAAGLESLQAILSNLGVGIEGAPEVTAPTVPGVSSQITADQLAAIFQEGAKQVPTLTAAYANAAGARSANNSGLELALNTLNESLVREAAKLQQGQQALSTDAAYKGGQLQSATNEINARNWQAMMQAQLQAEVEAARIQAQMAAGQKEPTVQTTVKDKGANPWGLLAGGVLLNQADKNNWWERMGKQFKETFGNSADTATGVDGLPETPLPSQDAATMQGFNFGSNTPVANAFMPSEWAAPSNFNYDFGTPQIDFGGGFNFTSPDINFDFPSLDLGDMPSFDLGDWGSIDTSTLGGGGEYTDAGSFTSEDLLNWELGFKNGGQPRRMMMRKYADGGKPARNRADMGAAPTRTIAGVQNREAPAGYDGLIAPIDMSGYRDAQAAQMMQMEAMRDAYEAAKARAEEQRAAQAAAQQQATAQNPVEEISVREGGNDSMANNTNQTFSPGVASFAQNALRYGGLAASLFGAPAIGAGLGMASSLANAQSDDAAIGAGIVGGVRIANPLLGFLAQQVNSIRASREQAAQQAALAEASRLAQEARNDYGTPSEPSVTQADTSQEQGVNYVNDPDAVWDDRFGFGHDVSSSNFSARGPGGSSGESGAAAGGAHPGGPGGADTRGSDSASGSDGGSDSGGSTGRNDSGFADGGTPAHGLIRGPGTGTSDSIAMPMTKVSNGEYIVSADVVNHFGTDFFDKLQEAFHAGGKPA